MPTGKKKEGSARRPGALNALLGLLLAALTILLMFIVYKHASFDPDSAPAGTPGQGLVEPDGPEPAESALPTPVNTPEPTPDPTPEAPDPVTPAPTPGIQTPTPAPPAESGPAPEQTPPTEPVPPASTEAQPAEQAMEETAPEAIVEG